MMAELTLKVERLQERIENHLDVCADECNMIECIEIIIESLEEEELDRLLSLADEELKEVVRDWEFVCRDTDETLDACMEYCYMMYSCQGG